MMKRAHTVVGRGSPRWAGLAVVCAMLAVCAMPAAAQASAASNSATGGSAAYATTLNYLIRFYPRYLTYWVQNAAPANRFISPISGSDGLLTSQATLINAFNVDTVYASVLNMNLSRGPEILTIPPAAGVFSMLTLDVWGSVFQTGIPTDRPGTYALVLPDWHGTLPPGVAKIVVPYPQTEWTIRSDRYSRSGNGYVNTIATAKEFISKLRLTSLAQYEANPSNGRTLPVPQAALGASSKVQADATLQNSPTRFLQYLQVALHSSSTQPLTAGDRALSSAFDRVFAAAQKGVDDGLYGEMSQIDQAAQSVDSMIVDRYLSHLVPGTNWINFTNLGNWGTAYLDRDATTAYIFLGNSQATSRYWDAFTDHNDHPLDTGTYARYTMTFSKANLPDAKRFWSVTAYVGPALHVTPGPANNGNRNVASYTPGLQTNRNGSVTIYIQPNRPKIRARVPNWVYVPPDTPFSLVLRTYGPQGNTAAGVTYSPPEIKPFGVL
jgi:hypothetical protein